MQIHYLKSLFAKRLHNLLLPIQGVINTFLNTSPGSSAWLAGGLLQLVRWTIHHFKSSCNAILCTQPEEECHPHSIPGKFRLGAFSLHEQLPLCPIEEDTGCLRINPIFTKAYLFSIRSEKGASNILCS